MTLADLIELLDSLKDADGGPLPWQVYRSYCAPAAGYVVMVGMRPFFRPRLEDVVAAAGEHAATLAAPPPSHPPARYTARERVLNTARDLVTGDRNSAYGPPTQDFDRTAGMLTALFGERLRPGTQFVGSDVARIVACVKLSRSVHARKEDNWIDLAGYAACGAECEEAEGNTP